MSVSAQPSLVDTLLSTPSTSRGRDWIAAARGLSGEDRERLLAAADATPRDDDAGFERAHSVYRTLAASFDPGRPEDLPRIRVVLDGNAGAHAELAPLWERVVREGPPGMAAEATSRLASIASLRGDALASEALYVEAIRRAVANGGEGLASPLGAYASSLIGFGREVESLAVAREATARADASFTDWRRAVLASSEGEAHVIAGDVEQASSARFRFATLTARCGWRQRSRAAPLLARLDARIALAQGDAFGALGALDAELRGWAGSVTMPPRHEVWWHALRIAALLAAGRVRDARDHALDATAGRPSDDPRDLPLRVAALVATLHAEPDTDPTARADGLLLELGAAGTTEASAADRSRIALDLAEALDLVGRSDLARRAYDAAAGAALARLVELDRFARAFPALVDLSKADRDSLEAGRRRSTARFRALAAPLARRLESAIRAGHPVASLLFNEHGLTTVCAWCRRVRLADGRWLTVEQFLPLAPSGVWPLTHGICADCRGPLEREFAAGLPTGV